MIALDELIATIKRMEIILNNTSDDAEKFISQTLVINLKQVYDEVKRFSESQEFLSHLKKLKQLK